MKGPQGVKCSSPTASLLGQWGGKFSSPTLWAGQLYCKFFGFAHSYYFIQNKWKSQSFCLWLLSIKCLRESFVFNISDPLSSHGLKPAQADGSRPSQWPSDNEVTGRFQSPAFVSAQVLWGCVDMCQGNVKAHGHFYKAQAFPKWPTYRLTHLPFHLSEQGSVGQLRAGSWNYFIYSFYLSWVVLKRNITAFLPWFLSFKGYNFKNYC